MELPDLKPHIGELSFVLVGSAATGLCRPDSDVDIAIVCDEETCSAISEGRPWASGRPAEVTIDGTQVHFFARTFRQIEGRLRELDDDHLYQYGGSLILRDPNGRFADCLGRLVSDAADIRRQRLEGKLDMLLRRSRALDQCLAAGDVMTIGRVCFELITLSLKVIALLDDVPFDPRKRLFAMALKGELGSRMEGTMRRLFAGVGELGEVREESGFADLSFPRELHEIVSILSEEARKQGFRVGLDKPDYRHIEK
jgi:hypothetical protein